MKRLVKSMTIPAEMPKSSLFLVLLLYKAIHFPLSTVLSVLVSRKYVVQIYVSQCECCAHTHLKPEAKSRWENTNFLVSKAATRHFLHMHAEPGSIAWICRLGEWGSPHSMQHGR